MPFQVGKLRKVTEGAEQICLRDAGARPRSATKYAPFGSPFFVSLCGVSMTFMSTSPLCTTPLLLTAFQIDNHSNAQLEILSEENCNE